jgi:deazaflavin-dependent oxidoreductase (nitroreductase family)
VARSEFHGTEAENTAVIAEFRANGGHVRGFEGRFEHLELLLLHHTGARSGRLRVNPLLYVPVRGSFAVFGSNDGATAHPGWYHNLLAHPDATIEVGRRTLRVKARVADDEERRPIWTAWIRDHPRFAEFERDAERPIPVVILDPCDAEKDEG